MALTDVDYITKNSGWLYVNYQLVGYLSDEVKIGVKRTVDTFSALAVPGGPLVPIKKVTDQEVVSISAGLAVINAANIARALGQQTVTSISSVTAQAVVDADNDLRTVKKDPVTGKLWLYLGPGPGLAKNFSVTTLKKGSTTLVKNPTSSYEYTVDTETGLVIFEAGGTNTIIEGDTIDCVAYTYDIPKGNRIDFGATSAIKDAIIHFYHKEPGGKVATHAVLWKGAANGDFELGFGGQWVKQDVTWEGVADSTKVQNPVGYLMQQDLS